MIQRKNVTNFVHLNMDLYLEQSFSAWHKSQRMIQDFCFAQSSQEFFNLAITDDRLYNCHRWQDLFSAFVQVKIKNIQ